MRFIKFVLTLGVVCSAFSAMAANVAVGSCKPSLPSYPDIQQAVNSVPAGSTIQVCPGSYPQQVVINKDLIIKGIASGNQGAAIITVPAGGLVQNTASLATGRPIAAQLLVPGADGRPTTSPTREIHVLGVALWILYITVFAVTLLIGARLMFTIVRVGVRTRRRRARKRSGRHC